MPRPRSRPLIDRPAATTRGGAQAPGRACRCTLRGRPGELHQQPAERVDHLAAARLLRRDRLPRLADDPAHAEDQADCRRDQRALVRSFRRRRRPGRGQAGAHRARRLPARARALRATRRAHPEGNPSLRPAGNRQDADGESRRGGVRRQLLFAERLRLRGDVRRPRRSANPQALRGSGEERAGDHLHRRARRGRRGAQRPRLQPGAGSDAQPAPRRARRLQVGRSGRRHGRVEPSSGSRPGAAPAGPLRSPDARPAARSLRPRGDPPRSHAREAARRGRRPAPHRQADGRADRRRSLQHLQRGRDLRRPQRSRVPAPGRVRRGDGARSSPGSSSGAS